MASKGPKQSPHEAAAPPPPEINPSSGSAIGSVHTVTAEDLQETADEVDREARQLGDEVSAQAARAAKKVKGAAKNAASSTAKEGRAAADNATQAASRAKATAQDVASQVADAEKRAAERAAADARRADRWLTRQFTALEKDHPMAAQALAAGNLVAIVGLSALLGFRAWGLVEQGRFTWKNAVVGMSVLGAVGLVEGTFANYFYKAGHKKQ